MSKRQDSLPFSMIRPPSAYRDETCRSPDTALLIVDGSQMRHLSLPTSTLIVDFRPNIVLKFRQALAPACAQVELLFAWLKNFRRISSVGERNAVHFLGLVQLREVRNMNTLSSPIQYVSWHGPIPQSISSLEAILCTEKLQRRPSRTPDYEKENRALVALSTLADSPNTVFQTLADTILDITQLLRIMRMLQEHLV
jgi:hypothetical protein